MNWRSMSLKDCCRKEKGVIALKHGSRPQTKNKNKKAPHLSYESNPCGMRIGALVEPIRKRAFIDTGSSRLPSMSLTATVTCSQLLVCKHITYLQEGLHLPLFSRFRIYPKQRVVAYLSFALPSVLILEILAYLGSHYCEHCCLYGLFYPPDLLCRVSIQTVVEYWDQHFYSKEKCLTLYILNPKFLLSITSSPGSVAPFFFKVEILRGKVSSRLSLAQSIQNYGNRFAFNRYELESHLEQFLQECRPVWIIPSMITSQSSSGQSGGERGIEPFFRPNKGQQGKGNKQERVFIDQITLRSPQDRIDFVQLCLSQSLNFQA